MPAPKPEGAQFSFPGHGRLQRPNGAGTFDVPAPAAPSSDRFRMSSSTPAMPREMHGETLGAVLAGGASSRFGSEKTLALLDGIPLVARAARAVRGATGAAVVITGSEAVATAAGLPARADRVTGSGPLAGLVTAMEWAAEASAAGVLAVGGDMPFLTEASLRRLLDVSSPPATAPVSEDGLRLQPLCAWYSVDLLDQARQRLAAGERRLHDLLTAVGVHRVPEASISGDLKPSILFMSVNTRDDLERAASLLRQGESA